MSCAGESCWLDHILEIEDADPDDVTFVDVRFEGNQMICNGLDCQLFEFFNTHTIDRAFVFSETQFINNTMACYGDSCSAEEFFYIHDASWLTYTHGLFYHNEISCVGDIYTDSRA